METRTGRAAAPETARSAASLLPLPAPQCWGEWDSESGGGGNRDGAAAKSPTQRGGAGPSLTGAAWQSGSLRVTHSSCCDSACSGRAATLLPRSGRCRGHPLGTCCYQPPGAELPAGYAHTGAGVCVLRLCGNGGGQMGVSGFSGLRVCGGCHGGLMTQAGTALAERGRVCVWGGFQTGLGGWACSGWLMCVGVSCE